MNLLQTGGGGPGFQVAKTLRVLTLSYAVRRARSPSRVATQPSRREDPAGKSAIAVWVVPFYFALDGTAPSVPELLSLKHYPLSPDCPLHPSKYTAPRDRPVGLLAVVPRAAPLSALH